MMIYPEALLPSVETELKRAVSILRNGGIILYPTDTVWGLGCDATNPEAVARIFRLKKRAESKSMLVLVDSPAMLERYIGELTDVAEQLIEATVDPLTIIYDDARGLAPTLIAPDGSVGIRITSERFSAGLCRRLQRPIVSTSANVSGCPTPRTFPEIAPDIVAGVDFVPEYRRSDLRPASPSSIIRLHNNGVIKIIR